MSLYEFSLPLKANKRFSSTTIKELKPHLWHKLSDTFLSLKCVFETYERQKEIKKEKNLMEARHRQQIAWNTVISLHLCSSPVQCLAPTQIKDLLWRKCSGFILVPPTPHFSSSNPWIFHVIPLPGPLLIGITQSAKSFWFIMSSTSFPNTFINQEIELEILYMFVPVPESLSQLIHCVRGVLL